MIVSKAVKMAEMMNIPVIGLSNMAYSECPDCHSQIKVFGDSHIEQIAKQHNIDTIAKLPLNPAIAELCDKGLVELYDGDYLKHIVEKIEKMEESK
jgi:Mrp family chromosome partitioning ATPase